MLFCEFAETVITAGPCGTYWYCTVGYDFNILYWLFAQTDPVVKKRNLPTGIEV